MLPPLQELYLRGTKKGTLSGYSAISEAETQEKKKKQAQSNIGNLETIDR